MFNDINDTGSFLRPFAVIGSTLLDRSGLSLPRKSGSSQTIHTNKSYNIGLVVWLYLKHFLYVSLMKWRQRPDMTIANDRDFKHQFKQTKKTLLVTYVHLLL